MAPEASTKGEWSKTFLPILVSIVLSVCAAFYTAEMRIAELTWQIAQIKLETDKREKDDAAWKLREDTAVQNISAVVSGMAADVKILLRKNGL